ncbi:type IV pilus assembly protein PilB [Desulfohalotomaculum tongense]|uniref:GspE/PulE family protein n=1 Tax=Desulforadius tongensis TaxID=1216062 RepID=UPI00195DF2F3|nr:GspE/PulE family protein [Desulforadius tongensis]MBM7854501.1 type IV pilus assembly protein PilB [Desulforadius tongensis]
MFNTGYIKKLGQLLVENKFITAAQLNRALQEQKRTGERLDIVLEKWGLVSEQDIVNLLEKQLNIPRVVIPNKVSAAVLRLIPEMVIRRYKVFPVKKDDVFLTVAMADPLNALVIDELQQITKFKITPALAARQQIDAAIARHFELVQLEQELKFHEDEIDYSRLAAYGSEGNESAVVRLVNSIIDQGIADGASDIHVEPQEDCVLVRERVDGILREMMTLPYSARHSVVSRIKILAQLDIAEKRLPQDGRLIYKSSIDLRISTMPTVFGEKVVIRILPRNRELMDINKLGFSDGNLKTFRKLIISSHGMILITGPTGSGKTTTLYAVLNELNSPEKNIITIEDPVEYTIKGVNQIPVNTKTGLNFATGLRSILRQDPDVIMVGEIRDPETAEIAVRAATTGHLVLCTMHTGDAADAITRLTDMGVPSYLVASTVIGVVAQRLVRKICPNCREVYYPEPNDPELVYAGIDNHRALYRAKGCVHCAYTGYSGRLGIHEILVANKRVKELINQKAPAGEIKKVSLESGMISIKQDGVQKALNALTTLQEVMRVTYSVVD